MAAAKREKAVSYLRVSGASQIDGHGFQRQFEAVQDWAKASGCRIEREYRELAVSGTKDGDERPVFRRMVTDLLSNGIRTMVVESLDRLAREYRVQESLLVYLASKGISLIAANTGEDITAAILDDPMKKALVQMQGVFSELDKALLVRKLRKAREAQREQTGKCEGQKLYGELPGEAEVVERIQQLRRKPRGRERLSFAAIAKRLNAEGIRTRSDGEWRAEQVRRVLVPKVNQARRKRPRKSAQVGTRT